MADAAQNCQTFSGVAICVIVILLIVSYVLYSTYSTTYTQSNQKIASLESQLADAQAAVPASSGSGSSSGSGTTTSSPTPTTIPSTPAAQTVTLTVGSQTANNSGYAVVNQLGQLPNNIDTVTDLQINFDFSTSVSNVILGVSSTQQSAQKYCTYLYGPSGAVTSINQDVPSSYIPGNPTGSSGGMTTAYNTVQAFPSGYISLSAYATGNGVAMSGTMTITYIPTQ